MLVGNLRADLLHYEAQKLENEYKQMCTGDTCHGMYRGSVKAKDLAKSKFHTLPKNTYSLNRYYFLRYCDSPESLAQVIYGDKRKAGHLKYWNRGTPWKAGNVIYYKSPVNNSRGLGNLFGEHPGRTEIYTVKRGDNLYKIADRTLGDHRSWKEIAYNNYIKSPDSVEIGQKIVLKYLR